MGSKRTIKCPYVRVKFEEKKQKEENEKESVFQFYNKHC